MNRKKSIISVICLYCFVGVLVLVLSLTGIINTDGIAADNTPPTQAPTNVPDDDPIASQTPTDIPVDPVTSQTPTDIPVDPIASQAPTDVPVNPATPQTPTDIPVDPIASQTPTDVPVDPIASQAPTDVPVDPAITQTPTDVPVDPATSQVKFILTNVNDTLNVRSAPSLDGDIIARLRKGDNGIVLEPGEAFSKIQCGDITGYVSNDYILTGEAAEKKIEQLNKTRVVINKSCYIRKGPGMSYGKLEIAKTGNSYPYNEAATNNKNWYAIILDDDSTGYVSTGYCKLVTP